MKLRTRAYVLICGLPVFILTAAFLPSSTSDVNRQGNKNFEDKKYEAALERYLAAQVRNPDDAIVRYNSAAALYELGQYKEASEAYQAGLELASKQTSLPEEAFRLDLFYNYGNSLYRLGKFDEAMNAYKAALDIDPSDEDAKYNLEVLQKTKNKFEKENQEKKQEERGGGQEPEPQEKKQNEKQKGEGIDKPDQNKNSGDTSDREKGENKQDQKQDHQGSSEQKDESTEGSSEGQDAGGKESPRDSSKKEKGKGSSESSESSESKGESSKDTPSDAGEPDNSSQESQKQPGQEPSDRESQEGKQDKGREPPDAESSDTSPPPGELKKSPVNDRPPGSQDKEDKVDKPQINARGILDHTAGGSLNSEATEEVPVSLAPSSGYDEDRIPYEEAMKILNTLQNSERDLQALRRPVAPDYHVPPEKDW